MGAQRAKPPWTRRLVRLAEPLSQECRFTVLCTMHGSFASDHEFSQDTWLDRIWPHMIEGDSLTFETKTSSSSDLPVSCVVC